MSMKMSKFEKLGIETSKLGFGCMRLPIKDGEIDRQAAFDMVDYAYNNGITYFDTAWGYHGGASEPFMGEALKRYPRDSFYLATKMPVWLVETPEDFERIFNEQLERLQTDHFDFYLLHALSKTRFDKLVEQGLYDLCKKKQAEGKIKYIGFSFHDHTDRFEEMVDKYPWDFVQIQYNYIDPHIMDADRLYKILADRDIPCVVMEPVRGGFLANLPEDIGDIFKDFNSSRSLASWALRWVASHSNVKVTLSGMTNMEQLVDNINTFSGDIDLSAEENAVVNRVVEKILDVQTVPCTACEYCMPCPFGVDIPQVFKIYNSFKMFRNNWRTHEEYFTYFKEEAQGDKCRSCGKCVKVCPQQIKIPEMLAMADAEIREMDKQFR